MKFIEQLLLLFLHLVWIEHIHTSLQFLQDGGPGSWLRVLLDLSSIFASLFHLAGLHIIHSDLQPCSPFLGYMSSIGYCHSRLSSFGTSNFFKKKCGYPHWDIFIRYLHSSSPHLRELLLYSCYISFTLLYWLVLVSENEQYDGILEFAGKWDCTECEQFDSFGRTFNALVSWIAVREQPIDNHIQALLRNSLVRLYTAHHTVAAGYKELERSPLLYKYTYAKIIFSCLYIPISADKRIFLVILHRPPPESARKLS